MFVRPSVGTRPLRGGRRLERWGDVDVGCTADGSGTWGGRELDRSVNIFFGKGGGGKGF